MISTRTTPVLLLILLLAALVLAGCGGNDASGENGGAGDGGSDGASPASTTTTVASGDTTGDGDAARGCADRPETTDRRWDAPPPMKLDRSRTYTAEIRTCKGTMTVELLPKQGPNAVNNFVFLARQGYFRGVVFHRIIEDFMVQTGDPEGTGMGGPGYSIPDDPVKMKYTKGVVAMANAGPNTGGSQFFIVTQDAAHLDQSPTYSIIGRVTKGLDVLADIADTPVQPNQDGEPSQPTEEVWIEDIVIREG